MFSIHSAIRNVDIARAEKNYKGDKEMEDIRKREIKGTEESRCQLLAEHEKREQGKQKVTSGKLQR